MSAIYIITINATESVSILIGKLINKIVPKKAPIPPPKANEKVKFQWQTGEEDDHEYFFEFFLQVDEITKDVSLIVSDFSDEDELDESKMLWNNLIQDLKQVLGSS